MDLVKSILTTSELSKYLNVKESWIRSLVFKRKIPFIKIEGLLRFKKEAIDEWLKQKEN
jgi:excisionase family DNA binding protein